MDVNVLLAGVVVSSLGAGMFLYGKKEGRLVPLVVGLALGVLPFVIYDLKSLIGITLVLLVLTWFLREKA